MDELAAIIFETSRTPLLVLERSGKVVAANRAYLMAFEVTQTEVIGSVLPDLRSIAEEGGRTTDFQVSSVVPFRGKCTFTINARKLGEHVLVALEDSTDRSRSIEELLKAKDLAEKRFAVRTERLAEIERRLSAFSANLPGIAYRATNDSAMTMKFVSPGCKELLGYDPEDLLDARAVSYVDLIHPDDRAKVFAGTQAGLAQGGRFQREYR